MSKTYFINNADSYLGRNLLSKIVGPETEDGQTEANVIVTNLDSSNYTKARGVKKVIKVYFGLSRDTSLYFSRSI